jgi:hypothetical protein
LSKKSIIAVQSSAVNAWPCFVGSISYLSAIATPLPERVHADSQQELLLSVMPITLLHTIPLFGDADHSIIRTIPLSCDAGHYIMFLLFVFHNSHSDILLHEAAAVLFCLAAIRKAEKAHPAIRIIGI